LREAIYEQKLHADEIVPIYTEVKKQAGVSLSGAELFVMLSRCEYMMGRAFQEDGRTQEAVTCYERGIALAEAALAVRPVSGAYEMLSGCYGQACMLKSVAWVMANGLKVESSAKKALALDSGNAAASYFIASRWAFGPGVLGDPKRGIKEMHAILDGNAALQKDDLFNCYSAIAYAYERLKQYQDAQVWVTKALELYPTNKFVRNLLAQIETGKR
jgi:tetratricopeptide (TPR) repeat protein